MRDARYQRTEKHEREDFAGEAIVMHRLTHRAVVLNASAAALWEALQWPQRPSDLVALLHEAWPQVQEQALGEQVERLIAQLLDAELLVVLDPEP